jgi:SEC-C motif
MSKDRDTDPSVATKSLNPVSSMFFSRENNFSAIRRNAPCICGSGKKYKHCHGADGSKSPTQLKWWDKPMNSQSARLALARQIIFGCGIERVIETGTFIGMTTEFFARFSIPVITAECNAEYARHARTRLTNWKNVDLRLGDSVAILRDIARETIDRSVPTLFYLDAHWDGHLPLREEAELAISHFAGSVLMIDDFAVPDDPGYGFDDYGPGQRLDIEYLLDSKLPGLSIYFPSTPSSQEDGARRGCVVVTASPALAAILDDIVLLRRWLESAAVPL